MKTNIELPHRDSYELYLEARRWRGRQVARAFALALGAAATGLQRAFAVHRRRRPLAAQFEKA